MHTENSVTGRTVKASQNELMFLSQASCIDFLPEIFGPKQNLNSRVIFPAPKIDTCAILKISHLFQLGALGPNLLQWKWLVALNSPSGFKLHHCRILGSYLSQSTPSPMLFHHFNWIQLVFCCLVALGIIFTFLSLSAICTIFKSGDVICLLQGRNESQECCEVAFYFKKGWRRREPGWDGKKVALLKRA